jgi:hypothetical protein
MKPGTRLSIRRNGCGGGRGDQVVVVVIELFKYGNAVVKVGLLWRCLHGNLSFIASSGVDNVAPSAEAK